MISWLAVALVLPAVLVGVLDWRRGLFAMIGIETWLSWYLLAALVMLPGILLEYAGFDWQVLGDVGEKFLFFQEDANLTAHSGFFRASEMAAWHTATAVCLLLLLSSMRRISILVAFLIANLAVFFIATQLFGDLFVLLTLGLVAGFFLATPVLAEREQARRGAARAPVPSPPPMLVPGTQLMRR